MRISIRAEALAQAMLKARRSPPRGHTKNPFAGVSDMFPPNVVPQGKKPSPIAMDSDLSQVEQWSQRMFASALREGVTFFGYPILAELAQRPEYRRAVEIIALHMTRRWIKLKATGDEDSETQSPQRSEKRGEEGAADLALPDPEGEAAAPKPKKKKKNKKKAAKIKKIEDFLKKLGCQAAFRKIAELDGFFGRSHLYLDTGDTENIAELALPIGEGTDEASASKVSKDRPLLKLKCVEPVWCYPTDYNATDPLRDDWYRPNSWSVMGKTLHRTRLLTFVGREVPDILKPAYAFGGLSLTQLGEPYVENWLRTRQSVADIINAFSVMVLKTNLAQQLNVNDGEDLFRRIDFFNFLRDNRGLMAIDKEDEDFDNVAAPLGTLDALQAQTQEHMSAVWGIPIVELLGIQPAGLNASSEGEMKTFRGWINAYQERLFRPHLTTVVAFAQLSLYGAVDPEITFDFEPLEPLNEKELAELQNILASTDEVLVGAGILDVEEARGRLAEDEDSPYFGLDVEDIPDPPDIDITGAEPGGAKPGGGGGGAPPKPKQETKTTVPKPKVKEAA